MPYLTLNGTTVRVAVDSVSLRYVGVSGEEERSPSGSLEGGPLALKREWAMATPPVPSSEVDAWSGLLEGKGHSFPLNTDFYSARGRGAAYIGPAVLVAGGAKYGSGYMRTGAGESVMWSLGLTGGWTVMLWRLESGTWRHYLVTSAGVKLKDGVRNDAMTTSTILSVISGELRVGDIGGVTGVRDFDNVVALPYAAPVDWTTAMHSQHATAAWPALPRLAAAGTFAPASVTVRGKVTDTRAIRYSPAGTLTTGHTIQFTLREV